MITFSDLELVATLCDCGSLSEAAKAMAGQRQRFDPAMNEAVRSARLANWDKALSAV